MNKHFGIRRLGEIAHAELGSRFVISPAHLMPLWAEVLAEFSEAKLRRVLIEGTSPDRQTDPLDAYAHGDFLSRLDRPGARVDFCLLRLRTGCANETLCQGGQLWRVHGAILRRHRSSDHVVGM